MPSSVELEFAVRLNNVTVKASSISSVADFMYEHRSEDVRMVAVWLDAVKSERRPYQLLNLFYVANEVIRRSALHHPPYVSIFGSVFERAMDATGPTLERIHMVAFGELFKVWQEEEYFGYDYVENLRRHLYSYPSTSKENGVSDGISEGEIENQKGTSQSYEPESCITYRHEGTAKEVDQFLTNVSLSDEHVRAYLERLLVNEKACWQFLHKWFQSMQKSTGSFAIVAHLFRIADQLLKVNASKFPGLQCLLEPFLTKAVKETASTHYPQTKQLLERLFCEWQSEHLLSNRTMQMLRYHLTLNSFRANSTTAGENRLPSTSCTVEPTEMTNNFKLSLFKDMLNELSRSSRKIKSTSEWMVENGDMCNQLVSQWKHSLFQKPSSEYAIAMFCVAHEVVITRSASAAGYIRAFRSALETSIDFIAFTSASSNYQLINKCIDTWSRLKLFPPQFIAKIVSRVNQAWSSKKDDRFTSAADKPNSVKSRHFKVVHPSFNIDSAEMSSSTDQSENQQNVDPKATLREFVYDVRHSGRRVKELQCWKEHLAKMEKALAKFKKSDLRSPVVREKIEALRAAADKFRLRLDKKAVARDSESIRYKRMQALLYRTRKTVSKEAERYKNMRQTLLSTCSGNGSSTKEFNGRPAPACSGMFEESAIPLRRHAGVSQT
ncbi:CTD bind domain containing protein [Trichuris trichiura]|uniref:CTD bind domain containing protein n=1 Tax=Trichuris trichiura TaxID=36087 RepID=A0A077Z3T0_TRITR|nr:CTD bind domain containing protein [Trichuris trichiura]